MREKLIDIFLYLTKEECEVNKHKYHNNPETLVLKCLDNNKMSICDGFITDVKQKKKRFKKQTYSVTIPIHFVGYEPHLKWWERALDKIGFRIKKLEEYRMNIIKSESQKEIAYKIGNAIGLNVFDVNNTILSLSIGIYKEEN